MLNHEPLRVHNFHLHFAHGSKWREKNRSDEFLERLAGGLPAPSQGELRAFEGVPVLKKVRTQLANEAVFIPAFTSDTRPVLRNGRPFWGLVRVSILVGSARASIKIFFRTEEVKSGKTQRLASVCFTGASSPSRVRSTILWANSGSGSMIVVAHELPHTVERAQFFFAISGSHPTSTRVKFMKRFVA
jgi:hypothetical protein